jgi:hypothetical protein
MKGLKDRLLKKMKTKEKKKKKKIEEEEEGRRCFVECQG